MLKKKCRVKGRKRRKEAKQKVTLILPPEEKDYNSNPAGCLFWKPLWGEPSQ
jgi:hypothetical protein